MQGRALSANVLLALSISIVGWQGEGRAQTKNNVHVSGFGLGSSATSGSLGIHRVEAARGFARGQAILSLGATYFSTTDFFEVGDENRYQTQTLRLVWVPVDGLELRLGQRAATNHNSRLDPKTVQVMGDPTLGMKYSLSIHERVGTGVSVDVLVPTSAGGAGLKPEALRLTAMALGSFRPLQAFEISLNAGYIVDRTENLFAEGREIEPAQRFTADISHGNAIAAGMGIAGHVEIAKTVGFSPFFEVSGRFLLDPQDAEHPILATGGLKIRGARGGKIEFAIGGDYRISGAPKPDTPVPGLPPWSAFARLSACLQLFAQSHRQTPGAGAAPCSDDSACPPGEVCGDGFCGRQVVKEVVKEIPKEVIKEVEAPTFFIAGTVLNDTSGEAITTAVIRVSDSAASPLAVDGKTGKFRSYPLRSGDGLVQITAVAPGFRSSKQTLTKGNANEIKELVFRLRPFGRHTVGIIRGSLKDARTGKPIRGKVFVPTLNKRIRTGSDGKFEAKLKAGRHSVLISGRGYVTQQKEIDISPDDVVILNIDLRSKR